MKTIAQSPRASRQCDHAVHDGDLKIPLGSKFCRCPSCREYFGGVTAFDATADVGAEVSA